MARITIVLILLVLNIQSLRAEEDPEVTRAREIARQKYELDKARREADEARRKLVEQQRAIAMTRQGVVTIYNPANSHVIFNCRWKMWDGTYSAWLLNDVKEKRALTFHKQGGVKFEIMFSSPGGGDKRYLVMCSELPNDVVPETDDGRPQHFKWDDQSLDLYQGKGN